MDASSVHSVILCLEADIYTHHRISLRERERDMLTTTSIKAPVHDHHAHKYTHACTHIYAHLDDSISRRLPYIDIDTLSLSSIR